MAEKQAKTTSDEDSKLALCTLYRRNVENFRRCFEADVSSLTSKLISAELLDESFDKTKALDIVMALSRTLKATSSLSEASQFVSDTLAVFGTFRSAQSIVQGYRDSALKDHGILLPDPSARVRMAVGGAPRLLGDDHICSDARQFNSAPAHIDDQINENFSVPVPSYSFYTGSTQQSKRIENSSLVLTQNKHTSIAASQLPLPQRGKPQPENVITESDSGVSILDDRKQRINPLSISTSALTHEASGTLTRIPQQSSDQCPQACEWCELKIANLQHSVECLKLDLKSKESKVSELMEMLQEGGEETVRAKRRVFEIMAKAEKEKHEMKDLHMKHIANLNGRLSSVRAQQAVENAAKQKELEKLQTLLEST